MSIEVSIQKNLGSFQLDVAFSGGDEVLAILGGSGCGKSMTLRCIAGIITPDKGRIIVDGVTFFDSEKHINLTPQERQIGLLFQNYALFNNMTVEENIAAGIREKLSKKEKLLHVQPYIQKFQLSGLEKRLPRELSGGQQQRVALARILIGNPRLLMLDEPFSALDSHLKWAMELELKKTLREFKGTTLFVSHSREEVYRLSQNICVIDQGKSEPIQTVKELFKHPRTHAAALLSGCKNYARCKPVGENKLYVEDWDLTLQCDVSGDKEVHILGVRRHYVKPSAPGGVNTFPCRVEEIIDNVFSTVILLHPCSTVENAQYPILETEMGKDEWLALGHCAGDIIHVSIAPQDILLLH